MRVSLTLNGWPPLASHLAALLIGVAMANLSWHDPEGLVSLPIGSLAMALPHEAVTWSTGAKPAPGSRVNLLRRTINTPVCRLTKEPWTVMGVGRGWVLDTAYLNVDALTLVIRAAKDRQILLTGEKAQPAAPICEAGPRVSYGQRD